MMVNMWVKIIHLCIYYHVFLTKTIYYHHSAELRCVISLKYKCYNNILEKIMLNMEALKPLAEKYDFKFTMSGSIGVVSSVKSQDSNGVLTEKLIIIKESNKPAPNKQIITINEATITVLFDEKIIDGNKNIELEFTINNTQLINFDDMLKCVESVIKLI